LTSCSSNSMIFFTNVKVDAEDPMVVRFRLLKTPLLHLLLSGRGG
jgi:hypothetical protein